MSDRGLLISLSCLKTCFQKMFPCCCKPKVVTGALPPRKCVPCITSLYFILHIAYIIICVPSFLFITYVLISRVTLHDWDSTFVTNKVRTYKYEWWNFIFLNLFKQVQSAWTNVKTKWINVWTKPPNVHLVQSSRKFIFFNNGRSPMHSCNQHYQWYIIFAVMSAQMLNF